jgi:hypothetical protein
MEICVDVYCICEESRGIGDASNCRALAPTICPIEKEKKRIAEADKMFISGNHHSV